MSLLLAAGISAAGSLLGGMMSSRSAKKTQAEANRIQREMLEFQKQRYADWQDAYGGIQENLSTYYQNLSPEYFQALGQQQVDQQFQTARENLDTQLAQRGLADNTGLGLSLETQMDVGQAEARAATRVGAEQQVAQAQQNFLGIGLGQNPANSLAGTYGSIYQNMFNLANQQNQAAGSAWGNAINIIGKGVAEGADWFSADAPNNINVVGDTGGFGSGIDADFGDWLNG